MVRKELGEYKMIYNMTVPHNPIGRKNLLKEILALPGVTDVGEDHEFVFHGNISIQSDVAELAYKYLVNASWIGEDKDNEKP